MRPQLGSNVTWATGNARLLKLAAKLETPRVRKHFIYNRWVDIPWKGRADLSCGTNACAMGWATTMPEFRKLGLRLTQAGKPTIYTIGVFGVQAAMAIFRTRLRRCPLAVHSNRV